MPKLNSTPTSKHSRATGGALARNTLSATLVGLMLLTGGAQWALAADEPASSGDDTLAEIVVQAQRRSERAQDVPISITTVSADALAASGVTSAASLAVAVPGLVVASTQAAFQPRLRGVGTTFFGPGIENPVALYVDNVYYASQLQAPTDLSDVAQVTVLKGPQGTLFGRNSTGGVIQMTTLEPLAQFSSQFRTELDNYLTSRSFAYVTGPVADGLSANLSVKYTTQDHGWGRNLVNQDDIFRVKSDIALRNKWLWTPADETVVKLALDYAKRDDNMGPDYYVPQVRGFTGLFPGIGVTQTASNPYDITNWATDNNSLRKDGASLEISQGLGGPHLVSISAFRSYDFDNFSPSDGSNTPESAVAYHTRGNQFSQEFQLVSPDTGRFKWLLGAYYFHANDNLEPMNLLYYDFFSEIFYGAAPTSVADERFNVDLTTESYAAFGQGTLQLTDDTHLTLGARYTDERRSIEGPINNFVDGASYPAFDTDLDGHYKENKPTWRVALDHELTDRVMAYASYNRGFKSGGFNAFTASSTPYKAETVDSYELGLKSEWLDRSLRINPSFFYSKYNNMQLLLVQGCCLVATNAAKSTIYGLDLDAQWKASSALSFSGGLEWLHGRFNDFPDDPTSVPIAGGGLATVFQSGNGLKVPLAPDLIVDLSANYELLIAGSKLDFNLTDSYSTSYYFEVDNQAREGGYDLLNASINWTAVGDRLTLGLFGRNLTNKVIPSTEAASAPSSFLAVNGNPPRTYGVRAQYRFGARD